MGTINIADVKVVLALIIIVAIVVFACNLAYARGYEDANRSDTRGDNVLDAYYNGYNLGYLDGIRTERKNHWKR